MLVSAPQNKQQGISYSSYAATATRAHAPTLNTSTRPYPGARNVVLLLIDT